MQSPTDNFFNYDTIFVRELSNSFFRALQMSPTEIDVALASQQNEDYFNLLKTIPGTNLQIIPGDDSVPDCNFIEDTAIIINSLRIVIILIPGDPTRRPETRAAEERIQEIIASNTNPQFPKFEIFRMTGEATADGGDILITPSHIFVGLSKRTNDEGFKQIKAIVDQAQTGMKDLESTSNKSKVEVIQIRVTEGLHFKSAISILDSDILVVCDNKAGRYIREELEKLNLITDSLTSTKNSSQYKLLTVKDLPLCNVLRIRETVILQEGFDKDDEKKIRVVCDERHLEVKNTSNG